MFGKTYAKEMVKKIKVALQELLDEYKILLGDCGNSSNPTCEFVSHQVGSRSAADSGSQSSFKIGDMSVGLFKFSFGIHLLQSDDPENMPLINKINPKDNHISFQCESMGNVEDMLKNMNVEYVKSRMEEGGIGVDQIFFRDPDGMIIEICNCDILPIIPIGVGEVSTVQSCSLVGCNINEQEPYSPRMLLDLRLLV
ncbi:hypothetical protein V2J09_010310 [Rumex salicifolius]